MSSAWKFYKSAENTTLGEDSALNKVWTHDGVHSLLSYGLNYHGGFIFVEGIPIAVAIFPAIIHLIVVLDILLLVVESDGVLSLSRYNIELPVEVNPSLIFVQMHQSVAFFRQSFIAILLEMFIHHAIVDKLLDKLGMVFFWEMRCGRQSLYWAYATAIAAQTYDWSCKWSLGFRLLEAKTVL